VLRSRFDDHLNRKLFHAFAGSAIAYGFVSVLSRKESLAVVLALFLITLPFELGRLVSPKLNALVLKVMGPLMRQNEIKEPSAQLYYFLGLLFVVLFLPRTLAIQSILILAWMDPVAGLVGVRYGRRTWSDTLSSFLVDGRKIPIDFGGKTLEGSFAGFCAAFAAGTLAWTGPWAMYMGPSGNMIWPSATVIFTFSCLGALVAVIAEAWPSQWDDNAKIPFWCGIVLYAASTILGLPLTY
jgi:dolichol kinase